MLTEAQADEALDRSHILTAVFIPAGFSERLEAGEPASVLFKRRGSGGDTGQIVSQIVRGAAQEIASEYEIREFVRSRLDGSGVPEARIVATVGALIEQAAVAPPVGVEIRAVGEEENALDRLIPGVLTMFLMFAATISAASIIVERNAGTLERLLTTRLSVNQLFGGKFLASVGRAMVQALILLSLAFAVLRVGDASTFAQVVVSQPADLRGRQLTRPRSGGHGPDAGTGNMGVGLPDHDPDRVQRNLHQRGRDRGAGVPEQAHPEQVRHRRHGRHPRGQWRAGRAGTGSRHPGRRRGDRLRRSPRRLPHGVEGRTSG